MIRYVFFISVHFLVFYLSVNIPQCRYGERRKSNFIFTLMKEGELIVSSRGINDGPKEYEMWRFTSIETSKFLLFTKKSPNKQGGMFER